MGEDFKIFLSAILVLCLPFGSIYLTLNILNWNEKKNLFLDSWFVFLTCVFSSLLVFCIYAVTAFSFRYLGGFVYFVFFIFSIVIANIFAIAGVLYLRSREKKLSILTDYKDENIQRPNIKKIFQTSASVSFLIFALVVGLFFLLEYDNERLEKQKQQNRGKISFGFSH